MPYLLSDEEFGKGGGGTKAITGTAAVTNRGYMMRVDSNAVFAHIKVNNVDVDVRTNYLDIAGATIEAGSWIVSGESNYFHSVQLTSGKVTLFKLPSTRA